MYILDKCVYMVCLCVYTVCLYMQSVQLFFPLMFLSLSMNRSSQVIPILRHGKVFKCTELSEALSVQT